LVTLRDGRNGLRGGLHCEVKAPADAVAGEPVLDFIATDETLDRYNEVIKLDGWKTANYLANPVVVDSHNYSSVMKILGNTTDLTVDGSKMVNRVKFAVENPFGKVAYGMAKSGFIRSESVGFIPLEWVDANKPGEPDRTYISQELLEISLVAVPANPGATVGLALKSGAVEAADLRDLVEFLKEFCGGQADPGAQAGASGGGVHDAQLLQLARDVQRVLRGA
jgi:HK97 family phage prohead protease